MLIVQVFFDEPSDTIYRTCASWDTAKGAVERTLRKLGRQWTVNDTTHRELIYEDPHNKSFPHARIMDVTPITRPLSLV